MPPLATDRRNRSDRRCPQFSRLIDGAIVDQRPLVRPHLFCPSDTEGTYGCPVCAEMWVRGHQVVVSRREFVYHATTLHWCSEMEEAMAVLEPLTLFANRFEIE